MNVMQLQKHINETKKNRSDAINRALLQRDIAIESLKAELFATRLLLAIGIIGALRMLQWL